MGSLHINRLARDFGHIQRVTVDNKQALDRWRSISGTIRVLG